MGWLCFHELSGDRCNYQIDKRRSKENAIRIAVARLVCPATQKEILRCRQWDENNQGNDRPARVNRKSKWAQNSIQTNSFGRDDCAHNYYANNRVRMRDVPPHVTGIASSNNR